MIKKLLILICMWAVTSCVDDELCTGTGTNIVKVKLFELANPATALSVTFDSIRVSGNPELYPTYNDSTLSAINLTVDPKEPLSRFVFYTSDRTDTLDLTYEIKNKLISPTCGPEYIFSNLGVSFYTFDSLLLDETLIEYEVETNIRIFY